MERSNRYWSNHLKAGIFGGRTRNKPRHPMKDNRLEEHQSVSANKQTINAADNFDQRTFPSGENIPYFSYHLTQILLD
jgi:hypothetical protein